MYQPFLPSQTSSTASPPLTPSQQAQATVAAYYNDWDEGKYRSAYNLLSPDYQRGHSYQQLQSSYVNVVYSCLSFDEVKPLPDATIQVNVTVNQIQVNPSAINVYKVDFIAQRVQGEWRIDPIKIQRLLIRGECVKP